MEKYLSPFLEYQDIIRFFKYVCLVCVVILGAITIVASGGGGGGGGNTNDTNSTDDSNTNTNDDTSNNIDDSNITPEKAVLNNPKSLFIASASMSEITAASHTNSTPLFQIAQYYSTDENILYQITQDDSIVEVSFLDENNSELEVITSYIEYINSSYIYIEFFVNQVIGLNPYHALINLETGTIYDISELYENPFSGSHGNFLGITNNSLFLVHSYLS